MKNHYLFFLYLLMFGVSCAPSLAPMTSVKDPSKSQVSGSIVPVISPSATPEELSQINDSYIAESNDRIVIYRNTKDLIKVSKKFNKSGLWLAKMYTYINWRGIIVKAEIIPEGTNIVDESIRKEILELAMGYKYNALPAPSPLQRQLLTLNFDIDAVISW